MARPLTCGLTSQLFTLTCLVALLVFAPCSVEGDSGGEESGFLFTAAPETIFAGQTETLSLMCVLDEGKEISGKVSAIQMKRGGEIIASVTPDEDAKALTDEEQLTVDGTLDENGNGYLSLTWSEPDEEQVGKYKCEVIGMFEGNRKKLSQVTRVRQRQPDIRDLIDNVKQSLQDEISELHRDIDELKQETKSAIQARVPLIQQGIKTCEGTQWTSFPQPYSRPPAVVVTFRGLDFDHRRNLRVVCDVLEVHNDRFKSRCHPWADTIMYESTVFRWISFEQ